MALVDNEGPGAGSSMRNTHSRSGQPGKQLRPLAEASCLKEPTSGDRTKTSVPRCCQTNTHCWHGKWLLAALAIWHGRSLRPRNTVCLMSDSKCEADQVSKPSSRSKVDQAPKVYRIQDFPEETRQSWGVSDEDLQEIKQQLVGHTTATC
ncbi:hypothetical protein ABBQ38_011502 [Trebouxia sp. C0009 RCD-2024]